MLAFKPRAVGVKVAEKQLTDKLSLGPCGQTQTTNQLMHRPYTLVFYGNYWARESY